MCYIAICNAQISQDIVQSIDTLFNLTNNQSPGYIVGVVEKDRCIFSKAYGQANLENEISINENTSFNIASLSKQITGAAIAILTLEDKLDLNDYVSDYLLGFPFVKDSVKNKHFIYMISGINDYRYNDRLNGTDWSSLNYFNIDTAIIASYNSRELMYQPGSQWSYSNINYMLLAKIVEEVSETSFAKFVKQNIFNPLEMNSSIVNDDIFEIMPNRAYGYNYRTDDETNWLIESGYLKEKGRGLLQIHRNSPHYGGSGIYTILNDWVRWISNFYSKKIGGQEFYDLMHKTMKFEHEKSNDAFGLVIDKHKEKDVVWYIGGDWGCSSFMIRFPKTETLIICFSNIGTGNARSKVLSIYDILIENGVLE